MQVFGLSGSVEGHGEERLPLHRSAGMSSSFLEFRTATVRLYGEVFIRRREVTRSDDVEVMLSDGVLTPR